MPPKRTKKAKLAVVPKGPLRRSKRIASRHEFLAEKIPKIAEEPTTDLDTKVVRYQTIGSNGRPVYVTETYNKEYRQNKKYIQEKESFERIRVQFFKDRKEETDD